MGCATMDILIAIENLRATILSGIADGSVFARDRVAISQALKALGREIEVRDA